MYYRIGFSSLFFLNLWHNTPHQSGKLKHIVLQIPSVGASCSSLSPSAWKGSRLDPRRLWNHNCRPHPRSAPAQCPLSEVVLQLKCTIGPPEANKYRNSNSTSTSQDPINPKRQIYLQILHFYLLFINILQYSPIRQSLKPSRHARH